MTKDQIQKLDPEQQMTLGMMEVNRVKRSQRLLSRARGYRIQLFIIMGVISIGILLGIYLLPASESQSVSKMFPFLLLMLFTNVWVGFISQRLDAMIELMEENSD